MKYIAILDEEQKKFLENIQINDRHLEIKQVSDELADDILSDLEYLNEGRGFLK